MKVMLKELNRSSVRDFTIDPVDVDIVSKIKSSITEHGFWGGVVCRRNGKGDLQVVAGAHRVEAAIASGMKEADVFVDEKMDDTQSVRVYSGENATQRGNMGTALTGSIAAAVKLLVKQRISPSRIIDRDSLNKSIDYRHEPHDVGEKSIEELLTGIPGINLISIRQQLANLKASGDYHRIVDGVYIEEGKKPPFGKVESTFDYVGIAKSLKNPHQVDTFRELVTKGEIKKALSVDKQKHVAKSLVDKSARIGRPLSSAFIKTELAHSVISVKKKAHKENKEEKIRLLRENLRERLIEYQKDIARNLRSIRNSGIKMEQLLANEWPVGEKYPMVGEFVTNLEDVFPILEKLYRRVKHESGNGISKAISPFIR